MNSSVSKLLAILMGDAEEVCARLDLSSLRGKTIMITGASGLLGTHFLACLRKLTEEKNDIEIIAVARSLPTKYLIALLEGRISKFFCGDIGDNSFLESLPEADFIIHAAGYGQPGRFMENAINTIRINTIGTLGLIEKLRQDGKFLFSSTSELYSGLTGSPHNEQQIGTTTTTHPRACYIEAKRCGEAICNNYRQQGLDTKSARLALAYGPGVRPGDRRVINSFIEKALVEKEIRMLDQGQALRTYCYITDAIYMFWRILLEGKEPVYNVGGITRISIAELAKRIGRLAGVEVRVPDSVGDGLTGAPDDVRLDITRFEKEFHPMSFVPIEVGLVHTLKWMDNYIDFSNVDFQKDAADASHS